MNAEPVDPALVRHPARILFEQVANASSRCRPARGTQRGPGRRAVSRTTSICDFAGEPQPGPSETHFALLGITSHMHKRSTKFVSDSSRSTGSGIARADDMTDGDDGVEAPLRQHRVLGPGESAFWPPIIVERA